jgi:FkbM family methyltransferase
MDVRRVKQAVHEKLHRLGFDIVPFSGAYFLMKLRVETMERLAINTVIDVGANRGQFVDEIRSSGWQGDVLSFEPLPTVFAQLSRRAAGDPGWTAIEVALGEVNGTREINVAANTWSSSLLPIADTHLAAAPASRYVERHPVEVRTLDDVLGELGLLEGRIFYLKVDTQGYELAVLAGASAAVQASAAIELEVSLTELYEGQPLIVDVLRHMLDLGFVPISMAPSFISDGRVLQRNALFVRAADEP